MHVDLYEVLHQKGPEYTNKILNKAATCIQRWVRGWLIRKELKKTGAVSRVEFVWIEEAEKQVTKVSYDDAKISDKEIVALIEKINEGQFTTHGGKIEKISETKSK